MKRKTLDLMFEIGFWVIVGLGVIWGGVLFVEIWGMNGRVGAEMIETGIDIGEGID